MSDAQKYLLALAAVLLKLPTERKQKRIVL